MHWMPMLAETYILNKVKEAQTEREQKRRQEKALKESSSNENQVEQVADN